jgi:hypothetical protein
LDIFKSLEKVAWVGRWVFRDIVVAVDNIVVGLTANCNDLTTIVTPRIDESLDSLFSSGQHSWGLDGFGRIHIDSSSCVCVCVSGACFTKCIYIRVPLGNGWSCNAMVG